MVRNLLENAKRYGGESDLGIELALSQTADHIGIRVSDHGPGVPAQFRERIFEPFYRLPGASERTGGVGLGLSLVKSIAERHGGRVRCEDRAAGGGASFEVVIG
jgi:signal transduction histidine kinase